MTFAFVQGAALLIFPILVLLAALKDVVSYTIPNWISLGLIAGFVIAALVTGMSPQAFGLHLAIGVAALFIGVGMFAMNWIGGGDAKLLASAGLWLGWPAVTNYLVITALAGGGLALLLLSLRAPAFRPIAHLAPSWLGRLTTPGENVPYGVAIAIGALAAFPQSALAVAGPAFF